MKTTKTKLDPRPRTAAVLRHVQRDHRIRRDHARAHALESASGRLMRRDGALRRFLDLRRG
jgi:hypothetical protein